MYASNNGPHLLVALNLDSSRTGAILVSFSQTWCGKPASRRCSDRLVSGGMSQIDRITIEPGKCGGRPCIRGYRLRVKDVLELLAHGASWDEILEDYSFLEREDIQACLDFAVAQSDHALIKVS